MRTTERPSIESLQRLSAIEVVQMYSRSPYSEVRDELARQIARRFDFAFDEGREVFRVSLGRHDHFFALGEISGEFVFRASREPIEPTVADPREALILLLSFVFHADTEAAEAHVAPVQWFRTRILAAAANLLPALVQRSILQSSERIRFVGLRYETRNATNGLPIPAPVIPPETLPQEMIDGTATVRSTADLAPPIVDEDPFSWSLYRKTFYFRRGAAEVLPPDTLKRLLEHFEFQSRKARNFGEVSGHFYWQFSDRVRFEFSDGTDLSLQDLLFHRYGDRRASLLNFERPPTETDYALPGEGRPTDDPVDRYLRALLKNQRSIRWAYRPHYFGFRDQGADLKDVSIEVRTPPAELALHVDVGAGTARLPAEFSDPATIRLSPREGGAWALETYSYPERTRELEGLWSKVDRRPTDPRRRLGEFLSLYSGAEHPYPIVWQGTPPEPFPDYRVIVQLHETAAGGYRIGFGVRSGDRAFTLDPAEVSPGLRAALAGGLRDWDVGVSWRELVPTRPGEPRTLDLKLLRSAGAFQWLFRRLFEESVRGKSPDWKSIWSEVPIFIGAGADWSPTKRLRAAFEEAWRTEAPEYLNPVSYAITGELMPRLTELPELRVRLNSVFTTAIESEVTIGKADRFRKGSSLFRLEGDEIVIAFSQGRTGLFHWISALPPSVAVELDGRPVESLGDEDLRFEISVRGKDDAERETARPEIDWFELRPDVFFRGLRVAAEEIKLDTEAGFVEYRGNVYAIPRRALPNFDRLRTLWERLAAPARGTAKRAKNANAYVPMPRAMLLEILSMRRAGVTIAGDASWEKFRERIDAFERGLASSEPIHSTVYHETLRPFQRTGTERLLSWHELGIGGILADDMGLGKTVQTLAFLDELRLRGELSPALVVVPSSLRYNWIAEAKRFAPELNFRVLEPRIAGAELPKFAPNEVAVVTYGLLVEHPDFFARIPWRIAIFDEAQALKNITSARTATVRRLPVGKKFLLSGTPLENHVAELFSLLDIAVPGSLGTLADFRKAHGGSNGPTGEQLAQLRHLTSPLLLRRRKGEILSELPPKTETQVLVEFDAAQRKIYRDIAIEKNAQIRALVESGGESGAQIHMLTALLRLRQICSDPSGIAGVQYRGNPPKIQALFARIEELIAEGESVLVFTQFLHTLDKVVTGLRHLQIPTWSLKGSDPTSAREVTLNDFNHSTAPGVLAMTLKTGGIGLNLTRASVVFHLEPWWNPAVENQATDRAHRLGQTKSVQVYRYIMKESLEERIQELKVHKQNLFDGLLGSNEDVRTDASLIAQGRLSLSDFERLIQ